MLRRALSLSLAAPLLGAAAPGSVPPSFHGSGVQIYACQAGAGGFAWHLLGPEATLTGAADTAPIHHFAGPSWQAADGSTIVGEVAATSPGAGGSIPWLVLRVKAHRGAGEMGKVAFIVRSETQGGVAPAKGCDKDHIGSQTRIPYQATYTFFTAP